MTISTSDPNLSWILGADRLPAQISPSATALVWADSRRTYQQLRDRALSLAARLRSAGLRTGDSLMVHLFNRGEVFELYFACAFAGLTLIPINFRLRSREIAHIVRDSQGKAFITEDEISDAAREALAKCDDIPLWVLPSDTSGEDYERWATGPQLAPPYESCDPNLILYTSGTTGTPKGVTMSHRCTLTFAFQQVLTYQLTDRDVMLITGPTYNVAGIHEMSIPTFLAGGTVAIMPSRRWTPEKLAAVIDNWGVTVGVIYPSMLEPLLEADARTEIGLTSMRLVLCGGENTPPASVDRFRRRWAHTSFAVGYGSTEAPLVTFAADAELDGRPGTVGRVAPMRSVEIRDGSGRRLGTGETGEVWAAGPINCEGYRNAPELNAETIKDGWLRIGDLGRFDEHGHLFIEGRVKDVIISKGQNIYPAEIENVLLELGGILEVAVIGLPDPEFGEAVCAVIVRDSGSVITEVDVVEHVTQRIASYKKPRVVAFVARLPRNPSNKVLKNELREIVLSQSGC